jgi:hypothetical protein
VLSAFAGRRGHAHRKKSIFVFIFAPSRAVVAARRVAPAAQREI